MALVELAALGKIIFGMNESPATSRDTDTVSAQVRLAATKEEVIEAQKLRYAVFYDEQGAIPNEEMQEQKRDFDSFDALADHLIVVITDEATGKEKIVGTYRLLRQSVAEKCGHFYSSGEYNLTPLLDSKLSLLELGRSCVEAEFRTKPILNLLWQGIADYIVEHNIDLLFGCASFHGTDISALSEQLSYLHHFHHAPENLSPTALPHRYINMNILPKESINERAAFNALPPLIKGYLRVGAVIGDGAVIDHQFNTTDICIVAQTSLLTDRYRKYYERKIQKIIPGSAARFSDSAETDDEI